MLFGRHLSLLSLQRGQTSLPTALRWVPVRCHVCCSGCVCAQHKTASLSFVCGNVKWGFGRWVAQCEIRSPDEGLSSPLCSVVPPGDVAAAKHKKKARKDDSDGRWGRSQGFYWGFSLEYLLVYWFSQWKNKKCNLIFNFYSNKNFNFVIKSFVVSKCKEKNCVSDSFVPYVQYK